MVLPGQLEESKTIFPGIFVRKNQVVRKNQITFSGPDELKWIGRIKMILPLAGKNNINGTYNGAVSIVSDSLPVLESFAESMSSLSRNFYFSEDHLKA